MTNYERIMGMSVEEMAVAAIVDMPKVCVCNGILCPRWDKEKTCLTQDRTAERCVGAALNWPNSEVTS